MIDSPSPGSGQVFDWVLAEGLPLTRRVILAGGLRPENVGDAVGRVRPWGVDVSSGVEREPGRKDASKVMRFINEAKDAAEGYGEEQVDLEAPIDTRTPVPSSALDDEPPLYDWEDDSSPSETA
jgi:phosphoribosylanthranilate isomerase